MKIFISYSHEDKKYLDIVVKHFTPWKIMNESNNVIWFDKEIKPSNGWGNEISKNIQNCDAAIIIISTNSYASGFIVNNEYAPLIKRRKNNEIDVYILVVDRCHFEIDDNLNWIQSVNDPKDILKNMSEDEINIKIRQMFMDIFGDNNIIKKSIPIEQKFNRMSITTDFAEIIMSTTQGSCKTETDILCDIIFASVNGSEKKWSFTIGAKKSLLNFSLDNCISIPNTNYYMKNGTRKPNNAWEINGPRDSELLSGINSSQNILLKVKSENNLYSVEANLKCKDNDFIFIPSDGKITVKKKKIIKIYIDENISKDENGNYILAKSKIEFNDGEKNDSF